METKDPYVKNSSFNLTHAQIVTKAQPLRYAFPGVYFLIQDSTVVYVGQSISSVLVRIASHTRDKEFDSFTVIPVPAEMDLNELEAAYIYTLEPHYNNTVPRNCYYVSKAGLKERLGIHGRAINRIIKNKRLRPHLGSLYDIRDFQEQEQ